MFLNLFAFTSYSFLILISTIGYGLIFKRFFLIQNEYLNLSIAGIFGLFLLYMISFFTHIFTPHDYLHNILVLLIGLILFFKSKSMIEIKELKIIILFFFLLFLGFIISKTNEDFPFYHLPLSLHLVEQKLQFGLGNLNFAYNHWSSLFLINSLFYLPLVDIYLFNLTNFLFQIFFFSSLILFLDSPKTPKFSIILISVIFLVFISKFNRLAEYGVDFAGQLLVTLSIIFCSFSLFKNELTNERKLLSIFEISFILVIFAISTKVLYLIYILIPLFLSIANIKFGNLIKYYSNYKFLLISTLGLITFIFYNFVTSGCLIYPISNTCFYDDISWTIKEDTLNHLRTHYNAWSKGGILAGNILADGVGSINEYIKSFYWIKNWIDVYFFTKVSDFLLLIIFVKILIYFVFKNDLTNKLKITKNNIKMFYVFYILNFIVFLVWFFNFPTLRYAGYSILFLILSIPFCFFIYKKIDFKNKNLKKKYIYLFIISIVIFNIRNIDRINNELSLELKENHNFSNFPFYWIKDVKYKKHEDKPDIFFSIENGNSCWATPSVCFSGDNLRINFNKSYIIYSVK